MTKQLKSNMKTGKGEKVNLDSAQKRLSSRKERLSKKEPKRINGSTHFREETLTFNHEGYTVEVEYLYFPKISDNVNTASSDWDLREELYIENVYITDKNDTLLDENLVSKQTILRELYMNKMLNDSF
jgi:HSP90 family molecular chaperone